MKIKLLVSLLVLCLALPLMAAPPAQKSVPKTAQVVTNEIFIDANNIMMFVTNHGNFGRDLAGVFGYDYGTFYPYTDTSAISDGSNTLSPYYAGGLWIGAVDQATNDTLMIISEYDSEYVPGSYGSTSTDARYKVFKLFDDSLPRWSTLPWDDNTATYLSALAPLVGSVVNQDFYDYVEFAIDDGAPLPWVIDTTFEDPEETIIEAIDSVYDILGDQYCWAIYNDGDAGQHGNDAGLTDPMGLEVIQEVFAFDREDPLGNIVFFRWSIWNRGGKDLDDVYFSVWSDPDLGLSGDDRVGCDIDLSVGYVYNADNDDQQYGSVPPCMGIDFFQGPLVAGEITDTAKMWGQLWPGFKNNPMTSFNRYENGTDPHSYQETYWYMQGLRGDQSGAPYTYNGEVTTFFHAGDPTTGVGDLDTKATDVRMMQTTGPLAFPPGDSTEILAAMIVGRGGDRLSSVSVMKYYDRFAQSAYDIDFDLPEPPAQPDVDESAEDGQLILVWDDTSEVDFGDYAFQGYTVFQGETPSGPWTFVANYDIIDGNAQILDDVLDPLTGALEYRLVKRGSDNGIQYYHILDQDYITGLPLYNHTPYYYKVEAYGFDIGATPKTITSSSPPITIIPERPIPELEYEGEVGSDVEVTHIGPSGGTVSVEIIDPTILTGHDYMVVFSDTLGIVVDTIYDEDYPGNLDSATFDSVNIAWHLIDATTNETLIAWSPNQSGDNHTLVKDGFIVRVQGPSAGFSGFWVTDNADGPLDPWVGASADWYDWALQNERPDETQQVGDGLWLFTTADNGGSCNEGDRNTFEAFLSRATRDGGNNEVIGSYDFEMRFTGSYDDPGVNGSYVSEWYSGADNQAAWVPFELWCTGVGTPDDPSDDFQMFGLMIDYGDDTYNLESWGCSLDPVYGGDGEHSISGADNDPWTDWVYWRMPVDMTPGTSGYDAIETELLSDFVNFEANYDTWVGAEALARTVLVGWNVDTSTVSGVPGFNQTLPEQGTVFRFETHNPNAVADTFTFTVPGIADLALTEDLLDNVKTVPNPFYLYGPYDPAVGNTQLKFINLPEKCTISIYNLGGDFVAEVEKDDPTTTEAIWNVQTAAGIPVASGIYIYVVDAPGIGQKIGKMAVFTETQVLDIY